MLWAIIKGNGNSYIIHEMSIKMKMNEKRIFACYEIAKLIYPDKVKISVAAKIVSKLTEMKEGSAKSYIKNFFSMRKNEKLSWCMAEEYAKHYFEHIYADFGLDELKKALNSLQKYLDNDVQRHLGLQDIVDGFKQKHGL